MIIIINLLFYILYFIIYIFKMFTKNIGIIFFILYLKRTFEEMTTQNNNSKIIDSVKNADVSLKAFPLGTFKPYFTDEFYICHIFIEDGKTKDGKTKLIDLHLNKYESNIIRYKIKDLGLELNKTETVIEITYLTCDVKLISELNENVNKIYLKYCEDEEDENSEVKIEVIQENKCLKENTEYENSIIDSVNNILYIDNEQYRLPSKLKSFYEDSCDCKDGKLYCNYGNKSEEATLRILTGKYETFNANRYLKLNVEVTIKNKVFLFCINDTTKPERGEEYDFNFNSIYIKNDRIYGYEYILDKYIDITTYTSKIECYIPSNKKPYRYLIHKGKRVGLNIKAKLNEDKTMLIPEINLLDITDNFNDLLDIDLFKTRAQVIASVMVNEEKQKAPAKPKKGRKANK